MKLFLRGIDRSLLKAIGDGCNIQITEHESDWVLFFDQDKRLSLGHAQVTQRKPLMIDFLSEISRTKARSLHQTSQPLLKALGKKKPEDTIVLDATAGLAGDSWLMYSAGFRVIMIERHPLIFLLLQDALKRLQLTDDSRKLQLYFGDSAKLVVNPEGPPPDVIYMDPMFPEKKKGRLSQGPMQWLQMLLEDQKQSSPEGLLAACLAHARGRVVVKRGLKDPQLVGPFVHSYKGRSVRYDMYQVFR